MEFNSAFKGINSISRIQVNLHGKTAASVRQNVARLRQTLQHVYMLTQLCAQQHSIQ